MLELPTAYREILAGIFQQYAPEHKVLAFGSRVNGTAHTTSDLDLALRHPEHPEQECATLPALRAALRESNIPFVVEVLDWARVPEDFRQEILHHSINFLSPVAS